MWPWRNFTPSEMACRCGCGEIFYGPKFYDVLQALRDEVGPLTITSGHRCRRHNALVGGAPMSQHLKLAVDVRLHGHDRIELARAARRHGFTGLGYYQTFLHLDQGRDRFWYSGNRARRLWASLQKQ